MTKTKEVANVPSAEALEQLRQSYPVEQGFSRALLPRFGMFSQDVTEGKGKAMKVIAEAGIFFTEKQSDEEDEETGKKKWDKTEIGTEAEVIVLYQRKQLKFFDGEAYTSSPVYDNDDEIVPLFKDKAEVDRGTPKELKSREEYQGKSAKGKDISKLEDNRILYVLYQGETYQLNLRGTSMYAFMQYARDLNKDGLVPSAVLTSLSSESKENGSIAWNQMTFSNERALDGTEVEDVLARVAEIRTGIESEKQFYAAKAAKGKDELDEFAGEADESKAIAAPKKR